MLLALVLVARSGQRLGGTPSVLHVYIHLVLSSPGSPTQVHLVLLVAKTHVPTPFSHRCVATYTSPARCTPPPCPQVAVQERDFTTARCLLAAGRDLIAVVERDASFLEPQVGWW